MSFNFKKITFYLVVITAVAFGWTACVNTGRMPDVFYLDPKSINIENLMFYAWQVQVTIALISISLTALIVSNLETRIYGQTIKSILMINEKLKVTYFDKIILVIILSVANLWAIMYRCLPIVIIIFIFSNAGVLDLILDSFNILFNTSKYEIKVKKYIDNNVKLMKEGKVNNLNEIITNIRISNKLLIDSGNIMQANNNIKYIISIRNEIINKNDSEKLNFDLIVSSIEDTVVESMKFLNNNNFVEESILILNEIILNEYDENNNDWFLERLLNELINKGLESSSYNTFSIINKYLLYNLLDNINNDENKSMIASVLYKYFEYIYYNNKINDFVKRKVILSYINDLIPSQFEDLSGEKNKRQYNIRKITIYGISKMLIKCDNKEWFGELVKSIYNNNAFDINLDRPSKNYEIIITLSIYLYYIIVKEEACEEIEKEITNEFLEHKVRSGSKYERNIKELVNEIGVYVWDSYSSIKKEMPMSGWEYMPKGAAKSMIMDKVIDEYYLFYTIVNIEYYDYEEYINNRFDINDCYRVLAYYNDNGELKDQYISNLSKYMNIYNNNLDYKSIDNKVRTIYNITNLLYAKLVICKEKEYYEMQLVNDNVQKLKNDILNGINKSDKYICKNLKEEYETINYQNNDISTSVLAEKVWLSNGSYEDIILNDIWYGILEIIGRNGYLHEVKYGEDNKIQKLLSFIESKDLKINSIVNNSISNNFYMNYNEKDADKTSLKIFEENLNKIHIENKISRGLLIKEQYLKIYIDLEDIIVSDIENKKISEDILSYKINVNQYKVNIVKDVSVIFTEEQIKEYFKYKYKVIKIKIKIKHNINKNEVIDIYFNR